MTDTTALVNQLLAEADSREAEANALREAAAVLSGAKVTDGRKAAVTRRRTPRKAAGGRFAGISGETYLAIIRETPERAWDAPALAAAMQVHGHNVEVDAARTMLYRLEKRGRLVKADRGHWRLAASLGLVPSAQPGS